PATTLVQLMMDAAERAHRLRAIGVHDVRLEQWLGADTPTDVEVTVGPDGDVTFGPYARATIELATTYPEPPAPWRPELISEPCQLTAAELYRDRWMFHGPAFQGVTDLVAIGDTHIRGTITTPAAPGALLDNVGQILGYWILAKRSERNVVFPVRMRGFRFYGPQPEPATEVDCRIRITSVTGTTLTADVQLSHSGKVWAEIVAWQDRRFTAVSAARPGGYPEHRTLAVPQPGGWVLLADGWPDLASRDLVMRTHLGAAEREQYEGHPPRGRRQWLLGRIAAKDAVRHWLWTEAGDQGPVFPAEIAIRNDPEGRPYAVGHHRELPPLSLSLAHRGDAAVALVREGADAGVGIDIELISDRTEYTYATALGPRERGLLAERSTATGTPESLWFTRFWAAKEAAAKAEGTGLRGRPRDFAVTEATTHALVVKTPRRTHQIRLDHVTTETPGAPSRGYVVAWTTKELFT
ncbi:4'-phosphopantetheinyl transferase superfamily protein, partial [Streptomyces sp. A7024]